MIDSAKIVSVLSAGTLRSDIYLNYDFAVPMKEMEVKLSNYSRKIGGSVFNTSKFISDYSNYTKVTMCTLNHTSLIAELANGSSSSNINILTIGDSINSYPMSIIGLDNTGEKRMISVETHSPPLYLDSDDPNYYQSDLFYTSFYELNTENLESFCSLFTAFLKRNKYTMIDLCPLIDLLDNDIIEKSLKCISVLSGNEQEYNKLLNKIGIPEKKQLFKSFPNIKHIFIKRGSEGAEYLSSDGKEYIQNNFKSSGFVAKNTTGCGDVFNGMVIVGLLYHWYPEKILSEAVKESAIIAEKGLL